VWKLGDVNHARRSRNTQEEIGADTLFWARRGRFRGRDPCEGGRGSGLRLLRTLNLQPTGLHRADAAG
jgi:hypothetical protein